MNTSAIIEKWYKRIGFDPCYDEAFYHALEQISVDPAATVDAYDYTDPDGKKNFLHFLYFCEALSLQYAQNGIPDEVLMDTLSDIPRWLNTWSELKGELFLGELHWLQLHLKMQLFKLGRLQFCMASARQGLEPWGIEKGEPVLDIHIPAVGPLSPDDCAESMKKAKRFFKTYFPAYQYRCFACDSWLLDPTLVQILNSNSNILQFQKLFTLAWTHESDSLLGFVFRWNITRADLPGITPTNPFAAKIKSLALQGAPFYLGYGIIQK